MKIKTTAVELVIVICMVLVIFLPQKGIGQNRYSLLGKIEVSDGTEFSLTYNTATQMVVEKAVSRSNVFKLNGVFPEAVICTLSNTANNQIKIFIAENSDMTITGKADQFYSSVVTNSTENNIYIEFKEKNYAIARDRRKRMEVAKSDLRTIDTIYHRKQDSLMQSMVRLYPGRVATATTIVDLYVTYPNIAMASRLYRLLQPDVQKTYFGKRLYDFVNAAQVTALNRPAPAIALKDTLGKLHTLDDLKGKFVLVDFWASWCPPCRKEFPFLKKAYQRYKKKGFVILGLSMDASVEAWKRALKEEKLTWLQLNDPTSTNGRVADIFGVKALPANFLIDRKGNIIAKDLRGDALEAKLKELLH